jgi:NAD(P)-dependent dehydrogenase (short-subunit alcohol dehydrogenase family)
MSRPTLIVTGASRGIGKSIVELAIKSLDANVIGVARSQNALLELMQNFEDDERYEDRFKFVVGDITTESTAQSAIALAKESWDGHIDGLVLNAG